MGEAIAVLSGKGGTGKTSVCAALAAALARDGQRVLAIDCDIGLQNLDLSLGMADSGAVSFLEVCQGRYTLDDAAVHPDFPGLKFLTAPFLPPNERVEQGPFRQLVRMAREKFDYILLDAPAGIDAGFELAAKFADRIVVVTLADPAAVRDAARAATRLEQMGKTEARLIVNRVEPRLFHTMSVTIDDVMDNAGLPLIGVIPEDRNVTLAAAFGKPLSLYTKRGATRAIAAISRRLRGIPVPLSIQ